MRHNSTLYALLIPVLCSLAASPATSQQPELVSEARLLDNRAFTREISHRYPLYYEQVGVGGTVQIKAFITAAGKPDSVRLVSSSGVSELDYRATQTVRGAKFAPATGPHGPQASWLDLTVTFGEPITVGSRRLANRPDVERGIQASRPADLKQGGVYAEVVVLLTVDSAGHVVGRAAPYAGCFPSAVTAALLATRDFVFEPATEPVRGLQKTVATIGFTTDSVRITLRGDADPPREQRPPDDTASQKGPTRRPELKNPPAIRRALVDAYPRHLRENGIGGEVTMWLFVDEEGRVTRRKVSESSGVCEFDLAALKVAQTMRFSPALKDGERSSVWVEIPIHFTASK